MLKPRLDHRIAHGTARDALGRALADPHIACADGFRLSVLALDPAAPFLLPAVTLEVGFPTRRPEPWERWREHLDPSVDEDEDDPTESVYLPVPVALVRDLIEAHGGEALPIPRQRA